MLADERGELFPVNRVGDVVVADAFEFLEEKGGVGDDLVDRVEGGEGGSCGGGEEESDGVVSDKFTHSFEDGVEEVGREGLDFVEDDDGTGNVVELTAGGGRV